MDERIREDDDAFDWEIDVEDVEEVLEIRLQHKFPEDGVTCPHCGADMTIWREIFKVPEGEFHCFKCSCWLWR